jgi:2-hydroxychromene-2-carboxylate isomerase
MVVMHYPVKESTDTLSRLGYCAYKAEPTRYWDLNDRLFEAEAVRLDDPAVIDGMLTDSGFDSQEIRACMAAHETETTVQGMLKEVVKSQFYGTPTIFIGEDVYVGPKPYRVYAISLKGLLYWLR